MYMCGYRPHEPMPFSIDAQTRLIDMQKGRIKQSGFDDVHIRLKGVMPSLEHVDKEPCADGVLIELFYHLAQTLVGDELNLMPIHHKCSEPWTVWYIVCYIGRKLRWLNPLAMGA